MSKPFISASDKRPCPVCGRKKWPCYFRPDESRVWCKTTYSERTDRQGLYLHVLRRDGPRARMSSAKPTLSPRPTVASPEHRHLVYSSLISLLPLSGHRLDNLLRRSLTPQSVKSNGYCNSPTREEGRALVRQLEPLGLEGVPGFYVRGGRWNMVGCFAGFFVPYRDVLGRIRGLSYRLDVPLDKMKYRWLSTDPGDEFDDGTQKYPRGTKLTPPPLHFAHPELLADAPDILLTEGALKADVASEMIGLPFIAAGGVTQWGAGFAEKFKRRFPGKRAVICYDSDWRSNNDVRRALEALIDRLTQARVRSLVRTWPAETGKGIDDYLLAVAEGRAA